MKASDKKYLKALGERVRALREKNGISQAQLGYECNLHRQHIGRIEMGTQNTSITTLLALAEAFNMTVSELLDFK